MFSFVIICFSVAIFAATSLAAPNLSLSEVIQEPEVSFDKIHEAAIKDQVARPVSQLQVKTRRNKLLDGNFDFCLDEESDGFSNHWHNQSLKEVCKHGNFYRMPVPSAFNEITSNTTVRDYIGLFWYQKIVDYGLLLDSTFTNLLINFENVNYIAIVWVQPARDPSRGGGFENSSLLGSHVGGFLPFSFNLTGLINGSSNRFRLTIAVSNQLNKDTIPSGRMVNLTQQVGRPFYKFEPDFDFFHFAGLMGSVHLVALAGNHITRVEIEDSRVWTICTKNGGFLRVFSVDDESRLKLEFEHEFLLIVSGCLGAVSSYDRIRIELYASKSSNELIDVVESYARPTIKREEDFPKLQGFGMHHETYFSGRSMSLAAIMKDIYLLKQVGANVIRTSHYPYSRQYLDACYEQGIWVIGECAAVGLNSFSDLKLTLHKQLVREMLHRDQDHPAIIMWSVANEPRSDLPESKAYFESLLTFVRSLMKHTNERPLTAAIAQPHQTDNIGHTLDVIMINRYYGWYEFGGALEAIRGPLLASVRGWHERYPTKGLLLSEFGAEALAGVHKSTRQMFSEEYQRDLLLEHERVVDELHMQFGSLFAGSMIWNFADFSTHNSLQRMAGNHKGLLTRDREPKLAFEAIGEVYRNRSMGPSKGGVVGAKSERLWRDLYMRLRMRALDQATTRDFEL